MNRILVLMTLSVAFGQQPDVFDQIRIAAEAKETEWKQADQELTEKLPALDPCSPETQQLILEVNKKSELALDTLASYYRAWLERNQTILQIQRSSEKNAAMERQKIRGELEHSRAELASIRQRVANLGSVSPEAQGRLSHLHRLIAMVEANERTWADTFQQFETESPDRGKNIAKTQSLVASINDTIRHVEKQKRFYDLWYMARIDLAQKHCMGRR